MNRSRWFLFGFVTVIVLLLVALRWTREPQRVPASAPENAAVVKSSPTASVGVRSPVVSTPSAAPQVKPAGASLVVAPSAAPVSTFSQFNDWSEKYLAASPAGKADLLAEGEALAKARRAQMVELIKTSPQLALELALPYRLRKGLPESVTGQLEERISGRGKYTVLAAVPLAGQRFQGSSISREATINGRSYDVFTYGKRLGQRSANGIALQGIALAREVGAPAAGTRLLALAAESARILQREEVADLIAAGKVKSDAICSVSGQVSGGAGQQTVADFGGDFRSFCHASHAAEFNFNLANLAGNTGGGGGLPVASGAQGAKKLLFIRLRFPDEPTEPISEAGAYQVMDQVNNFMVECSYNTLSILPTVTPLLTLPKTKAEYASPPAVGVGLPPGVGVIYADALAVAAAVGFDKNDYDLECIIFTPVPGFNFGGLASVGGRGCWLQSAGAGVIAHEFGHNLGLLHANFWDTKRAPLPGGNIDPDGRIGHESIFGLGFDIEYGDPFDTMGGGGGTGDVFDDSHGLAHYNAVHKFILNWLPTAAVETVTTNSTNRLYSFDAPSLVPGKIHALRIRKDDERDYWISHRQKLTENPWMVSGVQLHWNRWSQMKGGSSELLDATPGSPLGRLDSPLVIGRTFTEPGLNLFLTPVARGGTLPHDWIDVVVNFGPFPTNVPPSVSLAATAQVVTTNTVVTLTATAVDVNGDWLAYYWDFGDNTFGTNGSVASKSWPTNGEYVVRCVVTDMKGGEAIANQIIRVGPPTTHHISGRVWDAASGQPVPGIRMHNGLEGADNRTTYTDSDGFYTLVGLANGSYTCEGFLYGYNRTIPFDFTNPVLINGVDVVDVDFLISQLPILGITSVTNTAEAASPVPGQFVVTRTGNPSSPLNVWFHLSGKAYNFSDYSTVTNVVVYTNAAGQVSFYYKATIPAGASSTNISITPINDPFSEGAEDVVLDLNLKAAEVRISTVVTLTNTFLVTNTIGVPGWEVITVNQVPITFQTYPEYVLGPNSSARLLIADNDQIVLPTVSIEVNDSIAMESGNDYAEFIISRSGNCENPLEVFFTSGGTATSGNDYVPLPPSITIPAGQSSVILSVKAINDQFVEGTETVVVTLTPDGAYSVGGSSSATIYIVDDDLPLITVSTTDDNAIESGKTGTFTITRNGNTSQPLLVNYLAQGTALSGVDYFVLAGSVTIPADSSSATVTVTPKQDAALEGLETVSIFISDSPTYNIGFPNSAVVNLQDDELPTVSIATTSAGATEPAGSAVFTVSRTGPTNSDLFVFFQLGGTAVHQFDFAAIGSSVLIPAGSSNATINITPSDDLWSEIAENVIVLLTNNAAYNLGNPIRAEAIIAPNDGTNKPAVGFILKTSSGLESQTSVKIAVTLSAPPTVDTLIDYRVILGTASNGVDYVLNPGTLVWTNGSPSIQYINFNVVNDPDVEANETIFIRLFNSTKTFTNITSFTNMGVVTNLTNYPTVPTNAYIDVLDTHIYTIIDDDLDVVTILATEPDARETGPKNGRFTITRTGRTNNALTVNFSVTGTASSRTDYVPIGNSIVIPPGTNSVNIDIIPVDDQVEESTETINVRLISAPGAQIGNPSTATVCITDNDGTIQFSSATYDVYEYETTATISVVRTGDTNQSVSVNYLVLNGTATNGLDFFGTNGVLNFPPGVVLQSFTIGISNDMLVEFTETVSLVLTNPTGGVPLGGQKTATLNIHDDDVAFSFDSLVYRANENGTNAYITVNRLGVSTNAVFVTYSTSNGTASNGLDYTGITNLLFFAVGQTNAVFTFPIIDDILFDGDETVNLLLSAPGPGTTIGSNSTAVLKIIDDECLVQFTVSTNVVNEYAGSVVLNVQRIGGTINPVSVHFATFDVTASSGLDYIAVSSDLFFAGDNLVTTTNGSGTNQFIPGQTNLTITILILDDLIGEGNESFNVRLSSLTGPPVGLALPGSTVYGVNTNATVVIVDNETPGSVDYEFAIGSGANSNVLAVALQNDGKIVIGGEFTIFDGVSFNRIARLQSSGLLDTSFNPGAGANSNVLAVASQADGKVLLGGAFTTVDGTNRIRIARTTADGNLDLSFNPGLGANDLVRAIVVQTNGQVVIAGDFTQINGTNRSHIARLNANGSLDTNFAPVFVGTINALALDASGKIMAAGAFTSINGTNRNAIARLNTNGALDLAFSPGSGPSGPLNAVAVQADGKILIGGAFTSVSGTNYNNLARLTSAGAVDTSFTIGTGPSGPVNAVGLDGGGKILIGGAFNSFNGTSRNNFARLRVSGLLDTLFNPGSAANAAVRALVVQPDTALVIGGNFTVVNTLPKNHVARIHGDEKSNIIGVDFGASNFFVSETNGPAVITLVRSGNTNLPFTIGLIITGGSATGGAGALPGVDYLATNGTVSFVAGQMSATFDIPIFDDLLIEGDETVFLTLTNAAINVDLSGQSAATLVIQDNERQVQFSATNYVVNEGGTNAVITLTRLGGLSGAATVLLNTSNGTAQAGADFTGLTNVLLTFADGVSNLTVLIAINNDVVPEVAETLTLWLSSPTNATLGTNNPALLTIIDNDLVYGTVNLANTNKIQILDAQPAFAYPSIITVGGLTGTVSRVTVTLSNLTHTFPGDIDVLLVSPTGRAVVLMSDAGSGFDVFGVTLRFDDLAVNYLPELTQIAGGLYRPTDYAPADSFNAPAPAGPYGTALSLFNGTNPNGDWKLFIMDDRGADSGCITNGWRLSITTIDPATLTDLAVGMTDAPDPITAGGTLSYVICVTNLGPLTATGVYLTNALPAGATFVSASSSQGTCSNSAGTLICNLGTLGVGAVAKITNNVIPGVPGQLTNTVIVGLNEPDVIYSNSTATATTTVLLAQVADLRVTITDTPDPVLAGQDLVYVVTVTNFGPLVATGTFLTNVLPDNVIFGSATITLGSISNLGPSLLCNIGTLASGAGARATIHVTPRIGGLVTNTATAVSGQADVSPGNNTAVAVTSVYSAADLVVTTSDSPDPAAVNGFVTYTVTVFNNGPNPATAVTLFDTLPAQFGFVSATNSQGTFFTASSTIIFNFGTISNGASATASILIHATVQGTYTNVANVIANEADPNSANNTDREDTTVIVSVSSGAGIIQNGTIQMGVNPAGDLNVPGGVPSSGTSTTVVGLRYLPTGAESTAPGCLCEGWGVADAISLVNGGANESSDGGAFGLTVQSFLSDGSTARSVVLVGPTASNRNTFRVTHFYHPSIISNLYQVDVTIENISSNTVHALYRRVMDWDIEPTAFQEYSTLFKGNSTNLVFTSDNGFASANPLAGPSSILATNTFIDSGPADHGALFDFDFGNLLPGESKSFLTYYGAAGTEAAANFAIARIGAEAYSYGQPSTINGPSVGSPNTFIFAFGGIGGSALLGADVRVTKSASADVLPLGDQLTYTIVVSNAGPEIATGVVMTDILPPNVGLGLVTTTVGSLSNTPTVVTAIIGTLVSGAKATVTISVLPNAEAAITNTAFAVADQPDGNLDNNVATNVVAVVAVGTFVNQAQINILDGGPAAPYPSIIHVTGLAGVVTKVTASLLDVTHSFPADIDVLLVGPGGQKMILMSDAGQGDNLNSVTLKFDDDAAAYLPGASQIIGGVYKPTNLGGVADVFAPPAPSAPYGSTLGEFIGTNPNGDWLLYVMDDQGSDSGVIAKGWRLTFTTSVSAAPALALTRSGTKVIISWPAPSTGFGLEFRNTLPPPNIWTPVPTPVPVNGRYNVTNDVSGGSGFYRLRKP